MKFSFGLDHYKEWFPLKASYDDPNCTEQITQGLYSIISKIPTSQPIVIVCVGTDRSTGDALGPFVGTLLSKTKCLDFHLYGTINQPVHAINLEETMQDINKCFIDPFIIAIDACLGQLASVGTIQLCKGPVKPGAGVNKELPPVGNIHLTGIVNVGGFMEYFVLQNTRLSIVISMAEIIADALYNSISKTQRVKISPLVKID